jgi:hypothetical protein
MNIVHSRAQQLFKEGIMNHPGNTEFDVKDRLAIINLINGYADCFDKNEMDKWLTLFTDDIECTTYLGDNAPATVSGEAFGEQFSRFRAGMTVAGTQPMHANTNLNIQEQTSDRAVAEAYMLYIPMEIAAFNVGEKTQNETRITGTARYLFNLLKGGDCTWRINSYTITYYQKVVEVTAVL